MNGPDRAEALLNAAVLKLRQGDLGAAAAALEEAAAAQSVAARPEDQARSLQLAAFLRAAGGDVAASRSLAALAAAALPGNVPMEVASLAQRGEADAAEGRFAEAARLFGEGLEKARSIPLGADASIAMARRRGACLIAIGEFDAAVEAFDYACSLADERIGGFLRTEHARLLIDAGQFDRAASVLPASDAQDAQLQAEILVERSRLHRAAGELDSAERDALRARSTALAAVAPVTYFAASVELAELHDALGGRADAYAALASAWVTLSDLLGKNVARSWVEPCLMAMQLRWGEEAFAAARQQYETRRRKARGEVVP